VIIVLTTYCCENVEHLCTCTTIDPDRPSLGRVSILVCCSVSCTIVPCLSTACLKLSSQCFWRRPRGHVVCGVILASTVLFFHLSFSSHAHASHSHSLDCSVWSRILCSPSSFLMSSFCSLSLLVTPFIRLRTPAACTLLVSANINVHVSQPNTRSGHGTCCVLLLYLLNICVFFVDYLWENYSFKQ